MGALSLKRKAACDSDNAVVGPFVPLPHWSHQPTHPLHQQQTARRCGYVHSPAYIDATCAQTNETSGLTTIVGDDSCLIHGPLRPSKAIPARTSCYSEVTTSTGRAAPKA
jgi:hypothetical protein